MHAAYYGRSWLLVHYLIDEHLQSFLDFLARVSNGDDWRAAWSGEIPLAPDTVDDTLDAYWRRGKYGLWRVGAFAPDTSRLAVAEVSAADAFALRAFLVLLSMNPARGVDEDLAAAERDLESALRLDPDGERARRVAETIREAREAGNREAP